MSAAAPCSRRCFSPLGRWSEVSPEAAQGVLRQAFSRWGRPLRLRVDNGHPWGATGGLPTALALWLAGLGVTVVRNPPRCPQQNGVVERSQGTAQRWAEPGQCPTAAVLQGRLDEEDRVQREVYPVLGEQSRREAYPELCHSGRPYAASAEEVLWQWEQALAYLAGWTVRRRVSGDGKVSLYDRGYWVGREYAGEEMEVRLEASSVMWVVNWPRGEEVRRVAARGLSQEEILQRQVARPRAAETGQTCRRLAADKLSVV